ncbi:MAG: AzlC family ABC transporter permease [Hyphomicrobiaceae bacterium]
MLIDDHEMPPSAEPRDAAWLGATSRYAFWRGVAAALTVPGIILFASAAGFGALARDGGLSLGNSVFMMGVFFALPAQVVLLDQIARGASLAAGALAVSLTGLRLLPMSVALMPLLRGEHVRRWQYLLAGHFIAVTAWMEGWRRLPAVPVALRMPHFIGIGTGFVLATLVGTVAGFEIAGTVPTIVAAVLLFLTPIYFMLSLIATSRELSDKLAIAFGAMLGAPLYAYFPGFDLLLAGLIGGTLAHVAAKRRGAA